MPDASAHFRASFAGGILFACLAAPALPAARAQGSAPPDGLAMLYKPRQICFPATPPPLGQPIIKQAFMTSVATPAELSSYVNEPFYAPLSTRLLQKDLPAKLRQRLDAFHTDRTLLLAELRTELARARGLEPDERRSALAAMAQKQAARLAGLETAAEQLRGDLVTGDNDWSALREWRLGGTGTRGDSPVEIAWVMRAYAYYQSGLSPAQRRLLREITIEVISAAENANAAAAAQPYLFFMPEMTRVLLPDAISDEVAQKVADLQTKKSVLKKELFDAVLSAEGSAFPFTRSAALRNLAGRQAPRFAEVEALAEEIRAGLGSVAAIVPSAVRSPLSPSLTQRIVTNAEERHSLLRDSRTKIEAVITRAMETVPVRFTYSLSNEGVKVVPVAMYYGGRRMPLNDPRVTAVIEEVTRVGNEYRTRSDELVQEYEALRADIAASLGPDATPLAVERAINGVGIAYTAKENGDAYVEYRLAAFEPGLSPAQRRLLFQGSLEKLDVPLPRPEPQPTRRPDTW